MVMVEAIVADVVNGVVEGFVVNVGLVVEDVGPCS